MTKSCNSEYFQLPFKVYCSKCKEWIDENTVEFLNIEEDFEGKDLETFNCPKCNTEQKSHIVG